MQASVRLLSYYEVSAGLASRIGAGAPDEILARCGHDPSVRLCFREPSSAGTGVRLRIGSATLTDEGLVPDPFGDETERHGAWAGTLNGAVQAMRFLADMEQQALASLPIEPTTTWWLLELTVRRLTRLPSPDLRWIECEVPASELLAEVLVRMSGSADMLRASLAGRPEAIVDKEGK